MWSLLLPCGPFYCHVGPATAIWALPLPCGPCYCHVGPATAMHAGPATVLWALLLPLLSAAPFFCMQALLKVVAEVQAGSGPLHKLEMLEKLGEGGFGTVHKGRHSSICPCLVWPSLALPCPARPPRHPRPPTHSPTKYSPHGHPHTAPQAGPLHPLPRKPGPMCNCEVFPPLFLSCPCLVLLLVPWSCPCLVLPLVLSCPCLVPLVLPLPGSALGPLVLPLPGSALGPSVLAWFPWSLGPLVLAWFCPGVLWVGSDEVSTINQSVNQRKFDMDS